jgi:uncharacterized protein YecE (DUF72 family)
MKAFLGTSGYAYKEWKGRFYPEKLPANQMLRHYGEQLNSVETNNTFYRMPSADLVAGWGEQVPDGFSFAIKASRRITHSRRLKDCEDPVTHLFEAASKLNEKLGPVLFQLPPHFKKDAERLGTFLASLPPGRKVALEFRHLSWFDDEIYDLLRSSNAALCVADGELKGGEAPFAATADWGYLRLRRVQYEGDALKRWAGTVGDQGWKEAYVFFKHEDEAVGPELAARFIDTLGKSS